MCHCSLATRAGTPPDCTGVPTIAPVTTALHRYIASTSTTSEALHEAREDAEEYGLAVPDTSTSQLLATLAASTQATGLVAVTPAAAVVGLSLLEGAAEGATLTCIDPEPEHQKHSRAALARAGYASSKIRFLPSRPLDVMSRLAKGNYQLIYAEVAPMDVQAFVDAALPLLTVGGTLFLADSLLDGTLLDATRTDRETQAAREADHYVETIEGALVTRLPLGAGATLITKLA